MRLTLALTLSLLATPAMAGEWFQHKFGEARGYHGSWLAVCANKGKGDCRAVQLAGTDGVDGQRRMAINVIRRGRYVITVFQRGWKLGENDVVTFDIDGDVMGLKDKDWARGEMDISNVAETFTIVDGTMNTRLVADLKAGNQATVSMGTEYDRKDARFDLSGITAALNAIEALIAERGN
ncbi:MAG: invasion associated locus B family protein [Pseudomonadota bacterium]